MTDLGFTEETSLKTSSRDIAVSIVSQGTLSSVVKRQAISSSIDFISLAGDDDGRLS